MSVSLIIPVKNRKELLVKTLENVFAQTVVPQEIIVVDDHSTDGMGDFIQQKFSGRVIIIANSGHGPGAARNTGLRHSTGKYVKFFDSDDLMTRNTIEVQRDILESKGADSVYSAYFHATEVAPGVWQMWDPAILQYRLFPTRKPLTHLMLHGLFITIPAFMYRRTLLDRVGEWRTDITTYEDWDFEWRIATHQPHPLQTNNCAFLYRKHGSQTTGENLNSIQRDRDKVTCFTDILENHRLPGGFVDRLIFENFIANTIRKNAGEECFRNLPFNTGGLKYRVADLLHRITNKAGRMATGSNWHPMHGPLVNRQQVLEYLKMIDVSFDLKGPSN